MKDNEVRNETRRPIQPVCSISGDDATVVLRVELPGVPKDAIEVRVDDDQLTIRGSVPQETAEGTWLLKERRTGDYERSFTLDSTIDRDKIEAVHELGIMTLTLHVKDAVKPRRIEISSK